MTGTWIVAATAVLLARAQAEGAQPPGAGLSRTQTSLELTFLPGAWLPRLDGEATLGPPGTASVQLATELDLDASEATFNAELAIRKQEVWELILSGFDFSTDVSNAFAGSATFGSLTLNDGDPFYGTFEITSVAGELNVGVWRPFADRGGQTNLGNRNWQGHYIADLRISPAFGVRHIEVDQTVAVAAGRESAGGEWAAVYGGFQLTLDYRPEQPFPLFKMLRLQAALGVGPALGGDGGTMWQVRGGLTVDVTDEFGVMIGYRLLELDVENDDYSLAGGLQGLFLAGSMRF